MNSQKKNAYVTFAVSILFQILLFCFSNDLFHGGNADEYDDDDLPLPLRLQRSDYNDDHELPTFNVGLERQNATRRESDDEPKATDEDFENFLRTVTHTELKRLKAALENENKRRKLI